MDIEQTRRRSFPKDRKKEAPPDPHYDLAARRLMAWYALWRRRWFPEFHFSTKYIKEVKSDFVRLAKVLEDWNLDPRDYLRVIMLELRNKPYIPVITSKKTVLIYYETQKTAPESTIAGQVTTLEEAAETQGALPETVVAIEGPNFHHLACQIFLARHDDDMEFDNRALEDWILLSDNAFTRIQEKYPEIVERLNATVEQRNPRSDLSLHSSLATLICPRAH